MDVRILEYLIMIEQEKSISKAAQKVHISQSALSQNLIKVEKELKSPLFVRVNHQLQPTRIGRIYLDGAKEMLAVKEEVYEKISALSSSDKDILRIAVDPQIYEFLLRKAVPTLKKEYPNGRLQLLSADSLTIRQYLTEQIIDGGFLCIHENSNSMLLMKPLFTEYLVTVYPKGKIGESLPFIYPQAGTYFRVIFQKLLSEMHLTPVSYYEAGDFEKQRHLVEQNYGFTFLPSRFVQSDSEFEIQPLKNPYKYTVFFAIPKYSEVSPMLERFYEIAKNALL